MLEPIWVKYPALWEHGVTIPGGTESSVGVVGLSLGGGNWDASRPFGLTCDSLIEIELVVADGQEGARLFLHMDLAVIKPCGVIILN